VEVTEATNKNTLFVVVDSSDVYWRECFSDEDYSQYTIRIIDGQYITAESFLIGDVFFKNAQLRTLLDLFQKNEVRNGDIFVFANAWNFITIPLSFFKHEFNLDIKLIGFWNNSLFNRASPMFRRLDSKNGWGYNFEMSLFKAYDLNCFFCKEHQEMFSRRNYASRQEVGVVTGLPFGYLRKKVQSVEKHNIIFTPEPITDEIHSRVFAGLSFDFKEYSLVVASKTHFTRFKYNELLKAAKVLYCVKQTEYDPAVIYEAMLNGIIPILPKRMFLEMIFPKEYFYERQSPKIKRNIYLFMIRNRLEMIEFISKKVDNYEEWKLKVKSDAETIEQEYFSNTKFLTELNKIL